MTRKTIFEIGREVLDAPKRALSEVQKDVIAMLTTMELLGMDIPEAAPDQFLRGVMNKRLEYHFAERVLSKQLIMLLSIEADRPGTALLLLAGALACRRDKGKASVGIIDMLTYIDNGFPTEAALHGIWDGQKDGNVNSVDIEECWCDRILN